MVLEALSYLAIGVKSPQAMHRAVSVLILLGLVWAVETAVTILHCRRYIRDFIPEKRDPRRAPQGVTIPTGR